MRFSKLIFRDSAMINTAERLSSSNLGISCHVLVVWSGNIFNLWVTLYPYQNCCSVTKLCPTLCDPMNCSMPGFPVLHYLPEFAQTRVHWVSDAIQPSHPDTTLNRRTVVRMKELIYAMCIQQKLGHGKCSVNVSCRSISDCHSYVSFSNLEAGYFI